VAVTPIHFLVAFWGDKYRNYFETCLYASLQPQLRKSDRFVISCPFIDYKNMPIVLQDNIVWIPFAPKKTDPIYRNQNEAQKRMYQWCFDHKVMASMQSPDLILSQGYVGTLQRYIDNSYDVVQHTALRQNEETLLKEIGDRRLFSPRELADLNVRHLHRECDPLFQGDSRMPWMPPLRLWRVGDQLVIHSFVANPVLMNFAKLRKLNLRCVKHLAVENIFLDKNFRGCKFGLVTDSDELSVCSLSADYPSTFTRPRNYSRLRRYLGLQMSYYLWPRAGWTAFQTPSYWHPGELKPVTSTYTMLQRHWSIHAWLLGNLARFYLLRLLPWCSRRPMLKRTWRRIRGAAAAAPRP
jgi:hypothetical protein